MAKRKRRRTPAPAAPPPASGAAIVELTEVVKKDMLAREKTCSDEIDKVLERHKCGLFCKVQVSSDGRLFAEPRVMARRET